MTRVADITAEIRRYKNDSSVEPFITNGDCLAWINDAQKKLASAGHWKYGVLEDIDEAVDTLALTDLATDDMADGNCIGVESIRWVYDGANSLMKPLSTEHRYQDLLSVRPTGRPSAYFIKTRIIHWFPVPDDDYTEAVKIFGIWAPPKLTGLPDLDAPFSDPDYDHAYVYYGVAQAWLKDHTSDGYMQNYQNFMGLWEDERRKMIQGSQTPAFRLKPYRR